ncbi:DinB family protein [Streptomyces sp. NBC_00237]|uniref:DinB family protein n=1 Tax=Streptomyces sp. NBC_00237 TaxID=2975687 RepID=UPI002252C3AA|nr:DinB family protein [Streptomyces sp. NBC_00237]MCX5206528.1 DinB family protein [Streptomyces sp. NBC_00237]
MIQTDPKKDLHHYLKSAREALLWKVEGLSEYDVRRPVTPTGTNLLGLLKHLAGCEVGYFGDTFGRPFTAEAMPWVEDFDDDPTVDMWATAEESRAFVIGLYRKACAHADVTIEALEWDSTGHVPHWPEDRNEVSLHRILIHMLAETNRHGGHADIVRELIDGSAGLGKGNENLPPTEAHSWEKYVEKLEGEARAAALAAGETPGK